MLKKTITYTDYNGNVRTEEHYFNLSDAEIIEMETSISGGFSETLQKLINEQNMPEIMRIVREIVHTAYGEKSADGKYFSKTDATTGRKLIDRFKETEAYSQLIMDLTFDATEASNFVNGIMPANFDKKIQEYARKQQALAASKTE
jgi:hypothetical protein